MMPQKAFVKDNDLPHLEQLVQSFEEKRWGTRIVGDAQISPDYKLLGLQIYGQELIADDRRNDVLNVLKDLGYIDFSQVATDVTRKIIVGQQCEVFRDIAYDVKIGDTPVRIAFTDLVSDWGNLDRLGLKEHNPNFSGGNFWTHKDNVDSGKYPKGLHLTK